MRSSTNRGSLQQRSSIKTHGTAATPSHIEQYSPTLSILRSIPLGTEGQQPRINDDREGKTHETRTTPRDTRRNRHAIHFNRRRRCCIPARLAPIKFAGTIQYSHHWVRRRTTGKKTATVRNETDPSVASRAKLQAEQALDSGTANIHTSREAVDTDNATVLRVTTEDKTYSAVTFPLKGNGLSLTSNTTIVLSPDGAPATYSETHLTHNAANHFQMTSYTDGELVKDSDTGHEFVGDDVLQQQLDETRAAIAKQKSAPDQAVPVGAGAVAACLGAVLGIGGGAAWAITSLCGGSCAGAETGVGAAICAACIGGIATLGAGAISGAVTCFGYL